MVVLFLWLPLPDSEIFTDHDQQRWTGMSQKKRYAPILPVRVCIKFIKTHPFVRYNPRVTERPSLLKQTPLSSGFHSHQK